MAKQVCMLSMPLSRLKGAFLYKRVNVAIEKHKLKEHVIYNEVHFHARMESTDVTWYGKDVDGNMRMNVISSYLHNY